MPNESPASASPSRRIGSALLASVAAAAVTFACGGGPKTPTRAAPPDAGAEGAAGGHLATSPPPSGLPPMASMPPPGVVGSKKARTKLDGALAACGGSSSPHAKDPAALVKRLGEACAATSKMKPVGAPLRGQQGDKDPHQEHRFRAEANHCYRVYVAGDERVKDILVVLRDSAGDIIAEAPGPSVPETGAVCFTSADEVSILVGVGTGSGAWAAQVWGD